MSLNWDELLLGPVMSVFGEGSVDDPSSCPTYLLADGTRLPLPGAVYDDQYQRVDELGDTVAARHPVLGVRDAIFAAYPGEPRQNAAIFIPSTGSWYRVTNPEPDGHGHTLLVLIRGRA